MITRRAIIGGASAAAGLSACAGVHGHGSERGRGADLSDAFLFAFPIYEFTRTAYWQAGVTPTRAVHRFNRLTHRSVLADHTSRAVTTPNNDTIYSSARIDLTNGPVLLDVPSVHDRYFSLALMNAFTDNFAFVGTRATKGEGGRYLIAEPHWRGLAPGGVKVVRSVSRDVWALARIGVNGEADLPQAVAVQSRLAVASAPEPDPVAITPTTLDDAKNFLGVVNAMLARIDARRLARQNIGRFADLGLGENIEPDAARAVQWSKAIAAGKDAIRGGFATGGPLANGWRYADRHIGSEKASPMVRAATALSGLAAMTQEESLYAICGTDAAGMPLDGARSCRLVMPALVPCEAFWSVSMYSVEPDGRLFFADNALRRYSISDRTPGILRTAEGAIEIGMSQDEPASPVGRANWLPAPHGAFRLVFRAYLPRREMLQGKWRLPPVVPEGR